MYELQVHAKVTHSLAQHVDKLIHDYERHGFYWPQPDHPLLTEVSARKIIRAHGKERKMPWVSISAWYGGPWYQSHQKNLFHGYVEISRRRRFDECLVALPLMGPRVEGRRKSLPMEIEVRPAIYKISFSDPHMFAAYVRQFYTDCQFREATKAVGKPFDPPWGDGLTLHPVKEIKLYG